MGEFDITPEEREKWIKENPLPTKVEKKASKKEEKAEDLIKFV